MNSQTSPVLRLLIGGFAVGALGHLQGPVAMARELLAGGPSLGEPGIQSLVSAEHEAPTVAEIAAEKAPQPAEEEKIGEVADVSASINLGSEQSIDHLRRLVSAMEPQQAALILEAIPVEDAARVVTGLPVSTAVAMMSEMTNDGAAQLTEELAKSPSEG